ncbi:uncharacterized protein [Argopecten irradians]|uniref:uncharacterized protein n=1 Tax=Argopecten irradians TaxID=31199 RepID=UPI00371B91A8
MKGPKLLSGSICDHGRRHHKRVSSAKGRKAQSTVKTGHSNCTEKAQDDVINNDNVEEDDVKELDSDVKESRETNSVDGDNVDTVDRLPDNTGPQHENEDTKSINSDDTKPPTDLPEEKRHIVVDMSLKDVEEKEELEDDVFEKDVKKNPDENVFKPHKHMSRDTQKDNDLNPIEEGDESDSLPTVTDHETNKDNTTSQVSPLTKEDVEIKPFVNTDKKHTIKRPKSEKCRRPKSSTISNKTKRRPLSSMVSGRPNSASGGTTRTTLVPTLRVTKAELDYYLPRRSFFSCHDKALKDAGYGPAKTPRQTRMIEAWAKQTEGSTDVDRVPTPQQTDTNVLDSENQLTAVGDIVGMGNDTIQRHFSESSSEVGHRESVSSVVSQVHDLRLSRQVSNISMRSNAPLTRKLSRLSRRRGDYDEDEIKVDFQPLFLYLKYINENPEEYIHQQKQFKYGVPSQDSMVKMGTIFRRGRHGPSTDSLLVNVVHDINPRFSDPSQWTTTNKEKNLLSLTSSKKESGPLLSKHESHEPGTNTDEPKTEFEKLKHKMEAWLKTVTTAQLVKAKELALRELGEEDVSQSRWWVSLKSCHYLR